MKAAVLALCGTVACSQGTPEPTPVFPEFQHVEQYHCTSDDAEARVFAVAGGAPYLEVSRWNGELISSKVIDCQDTGPVAVDSKTLEEAQ